MRGRRAAPVRLVLAVLALLVGCSWGPGEEAPEVPVGTEAGLRAPELRGRTHTGEEFSLERDAGSPVVLVFYRGAYCGLCRDRLSRLQEHLAAYRELGTRVVAATPDPPAAVGELVRRHAIEFPIVSVDSAQLNRWGVLDAERRAPYPATFVLDGRGVILYRHLGRNAGDRATDAGLLTLLQRATAD